jgi:glutamyl-tRNA reductase
MKYDPNEDYEKWVEQVQTHECNIALERIAKGEPADLVMEQMARRITSKCLHPCFVKINENAVKQYQEQDSAEANLKYLEKFGPVADHVIRDDEVNNNEE